MTSMLQVDQLSVSSHRLNEDKAQKTSAKRRKELTEDAIMQNVMGVN